MPFKANADRRHHIPKQQYRATNSAAYDAALRQRGRQPGLDGDMVSGRQNGDEFKRTGQRGQQ